ncbi:MAG: hypothetical protein J7J15_00925 [Candidatus Aenigmarchaeota archaeon]|nr:hypothetical protein [Candidatus Aenigmarchaeota archaeon]
MKQRISLTVDRELLKQADKFIDNLNFDSRSSFIEHCISTYLQNSSTAVILAGGDPKKLKLGKKFKFLIPIKDDETILNFLFDKLSGFGKIFLVGQKEVINACFERISDKYNNTEIEYIEERKELGNAKTLELVKDKVTQNFLILPIDQYYEFDFFDLIRKHNLNHAISKTIVTLAVAPVATTEEFGTVSMIGNTIVKHEEGKKGDKTLISAFAAVCNKRIFDYIPKGDVRWVLQKDVYPRLINLGYMSGYLLDNPIFNINSEQDIQKLRNYLKNKKI